MRYSKEFNMLYQIVEAYARKRGKFMPDKESLYNLAQTEFKRFQSQCISPTFKHYCMEKYIQVTNQHNK